MAEIYGIKKINQLEKELGQVNIRLKNLYNDIVNVKDALDKFIKGDGVSAYWNGEDAYNWFNRAVKNHNNNIKDYAAVYNYAINLETQLEITKSISKKKSGKK